MYKAEFKLEAITPIFMRGADQTKAEIRAPSIKGLMRWWFRALAGSYFGDDISGLRKAEEFVFGSTGRRSRIMVELSNVESEEAYLPVDEFEFYFWFSQVSRSPKPALQPKTTFELAIKGYDELIIKTAVISLWLAIHLGGFGSRARKFAGSIFLSEEPNANFDIGIDFLPRTTNLKSYYIDTFATLLESISEILNALGFDRSDVKDANYPIFSRRTAHVFVGKVVSTPSEAIKNIGAWYLGTFKKRKFEGGFRFKYADRKIADQIYQEYLKGKKRIGNIKAKNERRPYLGLPIQFYKKFNNEFVRFTVAHWNANRRASSLIMTVNKVEDKYYPIVTVLKYVFLPNYRGAVKCSGGVYRDLKKKKEKVANVEGALFILDRGKDPKKEYETFYDDLINSLRSHFTEVFP